MPRRQFIADLQKAQSGTLPLGIANLRSGEDDGQFEFLFAGSPSAPLADPIKVTAMVPDLGDYPKSHEYIVFCADDAPKQIGSALQRICRTDRKTVFELVDVVAASLIRLSPDKDGDIGMPDSQFVDDDDDGSSEAEDEDDDIYGSDHEAFGTDAHQHTSSLSEPVTIAKSTLANRTFRNRIRADLRTAKNAGFKVGHLGHLLDRFNAFVTVSIRMSKLGISKEAMQAWQVDPTDYLILIVQYPNGYKTAEQLQDLDSLRLVANVSMRVCTSKRYKPTLQEAIKAFTVTRKNDMNGGASVAPATETAGGEDEVDDYSLRDIFISKPLNSLLQERLVQILRFRGKGMDWRGAEEWYIDAASMSPGSAHSVLDRYFEPEQPNKALPDIVNADHYAQRNTTDLSFPLLAMQFLLRHFVCCTDFCLVCHRKLNSDVVAIKPYVCDSSLCLYQYMTLGFGPSLEHEILSEPYVVDLLVSFCYNSAATGRLKDYPDGLALVVPPVERSHRDAIGKFFAPGHSNHHHRHLPGTQTNQFSRYEVGLNLSNLEIIFFERPNVCPVSRGSWIVIREQNSPRELHCRVQDVNYYPTIKINHPVVLFENSSREGTAHSAHPRSPPGNTTPATAQEWTAASFQVYGQEFRQLDEADKCASILKVLQTLPSVQTMQEHLVKDHPPDLKQWIDRISPAALSLLRWIIASNRACIMQLDGDSGPISAPQERLYGMPDFMQFRFAMGAPDKEQRFINEVRKTTSRLNLKYPTLFAFHGSPLHNWHMIIREGLHYKNADHGRAYGHGVYHGKDAATSSSYSMNSYWAPADGDPTRSHGSWPNSVLNVKSAMALNEIVNAPKEFTSHEPYYVVQHLDWIQTRYLFVSCSPTSPDIKPAVEKRPANIHLQDPMHTPSGTVGPLVIPASAITSGQAAKNKSRSWTGKGNGRPPKKRKGGNGFADPIVLDDDDETASQATDADDLDILYGDDAEPEPEPGMNGTGVKKTNSAVPQNAKCPATSYVPGTLDFGTLPLMPTPDYAVSSTTKHLMKELQTLAKTEDATSLADLGWYVDVEKIDNVYQWIVELHSFHVIDPKLPLVADMEKQKITSVVLEIRFNKDFPFSPPYVRVIRPRFLSRMQGGGGHIVQGGALCMELLTNSGWSSVSSVESVLMQVRLAIASDPPARLDFDGRGDYGAGEAAEGYIRACNTHGWVIPPGFKDMAYGGDGGDGGAHGSVGRSLQASRRNAKR